MAMGAPYNASTYEEGMEGAEPMRKMRISDLFVERKKLVILVV